MAADDEDLNKRIAILKGVQELAKDPRRFSQVVFLLGVTAYLSTNQPEADLALYLEGQDPRLKRFCQAVEATQSGRVPFVAWFRAALRGWRGMLVVVLVLCICVMVLLHGLGLTPILFTLVLAGMLLVGAWLLFNAQNATAHTLGVAMSKAASHLMTVVFGALACLAARRWPESQVSSAAPSLLDDSEPPRSLEQSLGSSQDGAMQPVGNTHTSDDFAIVGRSETDAVADSVLDELHRPAEPIVVRATLHTHTNNENKDPNTGVNVDVRTADNAGVIASVHNADNSGSDATKYNDESDHDINVPIANSGWTRGQVGGYHVRLSQYTVGYETWRFNARLTLFFSDGTTLEAEQSEIELVNSGASVEFYDRSLVPQLTSTALGSNSNSGSEGSRVIPAVAAPEHSAPDGEVRRVDGTLQTAPVTTSCAITCGVHDRTTCRVSCPADQAALCSCDICGRLPLVGTVTCERENCRCQ